ncbi:HIT family protein [Wolinella succinogenes]|uniref:HIT FAMILY PROTEIN n=1 Tax=Wolinella succinogenes (strain ATCC 29543 / DSM 1740 / CCUG 13145 / JCM 31913 / LMG 7466 / NCTC 11488 / FDC 602W) TaxID=273121 RepID=Q7MA74_WOLSU|nr:HIT domain-containing protein [Wolinella succinogenes]NLU34570.1 HIT domain-containing protein [Wolinella succinogenes]CAE09577.1 HIT FAMILY PROTEIN [Wolinella succinogenes]VEG81790.1 AP-4-A phosphorylase [Wolinella succinogenes]HCZ18307.1 HIT domain-containing protein [Helicobacter sp.]
METIYAPWRSAYFGEEKIKGCVFCHLSETPHQDEEHKVFYRDDLCLAVMNKFPYTPGHFMIIPHAHVDTPTLLSEESWLHLSRLAQKGVALLEAFGAHGVNYGINIKRSGGAGIPDHLHLHLVPRWSGDTNFITAIGDSRIYGVDFEGIFQSIKKLSKVHFA